MGIPPIRKLRTRIILAFALVLVTGQGIGFLLVDAASSRNARAQLEQELIAGERVFERLLAHNRNQLAQAATVLAADYGFREAIATRDAETLTSVLDNHGRRIDAASMQLISLDGKLAAQASRRAVSTTTAADFDHPELLAAAKDEGSASTIADGAVAPMQIVVVPVKAPVLIAWIAVGFEIDDALARDLKRLTELEVSFLRPRAAHRSEWSVFASTLGGETRAALNAFSAGSAPETGGKMVKLAGTAFGTRTVALGADSAQSAQVTQPTHAEKSTQPTQASSGAIVAVLQRSLDEKLAGFAPLRHFLLALALGGITVSILFSAWLARGITRPLNLLHDGAMRMRRGDYSEPIAIAQSDEIGALADSFNGMREEIALREEEVLRLAYQDALTGLPNRTRFNQRLVESIALARSADHRFGDRDSERFTVLMMDLDRFRMINDALGHGAGDHVLKQVALRLKQVAPPGASLARLGADEFALLLPGSIEPERTAELILEMLKQPILLDQQPLDVGGSIGIASYPEQGGDADTLVRHADMAMMGAKRSIKGYAHYDSRFDVAQQEQLSLLGELRRAVEADELRVFYQPKIDLAAGHIIGVEALVRWQHKTRGLVPPGLFMPYAEQTGFVRHVTGWMLERSIRQCGRWHAEGLDLVVSINISTRDLLDDALVGMVGRLIGLHRVPAAMVCLEITESSFMEDPDRALRTLRELDMLGVELSIDDFGTGYSSLAYLKKLPVDEIKIDRGFVMNMLEDQGDLTIVRSTIDLAHNLGLRVVAEGVESEAAMNLLAEAGCDIAQGFYASRPVPVDALRTWMAQSKWGVALQDIEVVRHAY